jgi:hypothetical protein
MVNKSDAAAPVEPSGIGCMVPETFNGLNPVVKPTLVPTSPPLTKLTPALVTGPFEENIP